MSYKKRGKVWRVNYRYNGVVYKETFDTEKQARARDAIVKAEKEAGTFVPPHELINPETNPRGYGKGITVRELMRHLSVTLKLLITGDVKAVQADSGHKDAGMVLNRYSHAMDDERKKMAMQLDGMLYVSGT